ncbi:hypothetical protein Tco_0170047 [Tanacetum coccineum]
MCWTGSLSAKVTPGAELYSRHISCVDLKKYLAESDIQVPLEEIKIDENLRSEYTWEREDQFKAKHPHLFASTSFPVAS